MEFREVTHGSAEYDLTVDLRRRVLREPLGLVFTEAQLSAESTDRHLTLWDTDRLVACLILSALEGQIVQMRQFAVDPSRQRRGLGTLLVTHSEKFAQSLGFTRMILHARDVAVPFYLRLGYEVEGEPFVEVGIAHRHMFKSL